MLEDPVEPQDQGEPVEPKKPEEPKDQQDQPTAAKNAKLSYPKFEISEQDIQRLSDNAKRLRLLDEEMEKEIEDIEFTFEKKKVDVYRERQTIIGDIQGFYHHVMENEGSLSKFSEQPITRKITSLDVETLTSTKRSHKITFGFDENEYFTNKHISKTITTEVDKEPKIINTKITWTDKWKNPAELLKEGSFFAWLTNEKEATSDHIAEIIIDELWPSVLTYIEKYIEAGPEDDAEIIE